MTKYQCVIIGCGPRGDDHASVIAPQERFTLAGVVDLREEARQKLAEKYGSRAFASVTEALRETQAEIVVLCTPPRNRRKLISQVLADGAPALRTILTEKPLEVDLDEARTMLTECRERGVHLLLGHQLRFCREAEQMRDDIAAGMIGKIQFVRAASAGSLFDQGSHTLDLLHFVTGGKRVEWVMSAATEDRDLLARHGRLNMTYRYEDHHPGPLWLTSHLGLEDNIRGTIESGHLYQRVGVFHGDWAQKHLVVYGDRGQAEFQNGSYYRLTSELLPATKQVDSTVESYWAGTALFYEELLGTLDHGLPHRCEAEPCFNAQETMFAAMAALEQGGIVHLPLGEKDKRSVAAEAEHLTSYQMVSVVLPMSVPEGLRETALTQWSVKQWLPRHKIQLIVLVHKDDRQLITSIRPMLHKQDKYVEVSDRNLFHHYNLGAKLADAPLVLFTEPRSYPSPECLEEVVKFFATHDDDGAVCRIMAEGDSIIGRLSAYSFNKTFPTVAFLGDFRKIIPAGFVLRRRALEEFGDFPAEFGNYAAQLAAARLHRSGKRLGYAPGAGIIRQEPEKNALVEWKAELRDIAEGQVRYHLRYPRPMEIGYLTRPPEIDQPWLHDPKLVDLLVKILQGELRQRPHAPEDRAFLKARLAGFRPPHFWPPHWYRAFLKAKLVWRELSWRLPLSEGKRRGGFERSVREYLHLYRLKYLSKPIKPTAPGERLISEGSFQPGLMPQECLLGFHQAEHRGDVPFRWTEPFALFLLPLRRSKLSIRIDTGGLHLMREEFNLPHSAIGFYFNGVRLKPENVKWRDRDVTFKVKASWFVPSLRQALMVVAPGLRLANGPRQDARPLGLPIFSIDIESLAADQPAPVTADDPARDFAPV